MRCRRCHTKLDASKKMCPVCGTLVRKKRGRVKLAPQAGAGNIVAMPMNNFFSRLSSFFESKVIIAVISILVIVGAVVTMIATGVFDSCACSGCSSAEDDSGGIKSVNSSIASCEYYINNTLYYVKGSSVMAVDDNGAASVVAAGSGITGVIADDTNIYYLQNGEIWVSPLKKPLTVSEDPAAKYASSRLISSDGAAGGISISGFALDGDMICCWGNASGGGITIYSYSIRSGGKAVLYTGSCDNVSCYRGRVYYTSLNDGGISSLYSIPLTGGEIKTVYDRSSVDMYAISDGCIVIYTGDSEGGVLSRIDMSGEELTDKLRTKSISSIIANDSYVYYSMTSGDGNAVYRMKARDAEGVSMFYDGGSIELSGIAGDYFSLWVGVADGADRYAGAGYYIFNAETREQIILN